MERQVMWTPWAGPGLEHLHLVTRPDEIVADGLVLGVHDQTPFRLRYVVRCDPRWQLRAASLTLLGDGCPSLDLVSDGAGSWATASGAALPDLAGCREIDIMATPFTNTLPIRRLTLAAGASATLQMVYITVPDMAVFVMDQRYTCLETTPSGGLYRYESLAQGVTRFTAELPVDEDGLVLDYPSFVRRVAFG